MVSGMFYPSDKGELEEMLDKLFSGTGKGRNLGVVSPHAGYPYSGKGAAFARNYAQLPPEERVTFLEHIVVAGETLSHIARYHAVSVADLQAANPRIQPRFLGIGQRVIVPKAPSVRDGLRGKIVADQGEIFVYTVRSGDTLGDIAGVRGDARGDDTRVDVFGPREAQVLGGRDVAQEVRSGRGGDGPADGGGYVIVAGGDVGHQRTQYVIRGAVAHLLLITDVIGDQLQRDVSRALDHRLNAGVARAAGEIGANIQLRQLRTRAEAYRPCGPKQQRLLDLHARRGKIVMQAQIGA